MAMQIRHDNTSFGDPIFMRILVAGATGFLGRYMIQALSRQGHTIVSLHSGRTAISSEWAKYISNDILYDINSTLQPPEQAMSVDAVAFLSWPGLPNYREFYHFECNLFASYRFIQSLVHFGVKHILVTGTCLEYGMRNGAMHAHLYAKPMVPYAIAKDSLHKFLRILQNKYSFTLQWTRLFYLYGFGQHPNSLLSQLEKAIADGAACFKMSPGDQLRDFISVVDAAQQISVLLSHPECDGIFNVCSGQPISVRSFVEAHMKRLNKIMPLELGVYSYNDYEPMAFWGIPNII